jgi:transposase
VNAGLRGANTRLRELLAERDAQVAALAGELEEHRTLVAALQAQVADLAAQVKANSKNSSRPPSSDGLARPEPKSLRKKGARRPGRPKGQPGATMQLTDNPDRVVRHEPAVCGECGRGLAGAGQTGMERRQVTEIPEVKATVTEHQMVERECPCCGQRTDAPAGVTAPVQYGPRASALATYLWHGQFLSRDRACRALADMFGCAPSPGAVAAMARKIAAFVAPALDEIIRALLSADVAHFDETGSGSPGSSPGCTRLRPGSMCWSPCTENAALRAWTRPGCCRPSPGSPFTTPGRRMTPTTASPLTPCATLTCCGS